MTLLDFYKNLIPIDAEHKQVKTSAEFLVGTLNAKAAEKIIPVSLGFRYIGSYERDTMPSPVDDVDIIYVIGEVVKQADNYHLISKGEVGDNDLDSFGNVSSLLLLNRIKAALAPSYPRSELKRNHEVVNVYLESYERSFDIVPAWKEVGLDYYLIPEGNRGHRWKKSNPFRDKAILDRVDTRLSGTAIPAIVILKHWFSRKRIVAPRSYHLEAISYQILSAIESDQPSIRKSLAMLLNNLNYNDALVSCADPTGLSEPLTSGLSTTDIDTITAAGKASAEILWNNGEDAFLEEL